MRIPLLLLLPALAACSGARTRAPAAGGDDADLAAEARAAGIRAETRPTRVSLRDHRAGVTIGLINEAHSGSSEFYSQLRNSPTYKVVPDLDMGALMAQLAEFGFFRTADKSSSRVAGARVTVQVDRGGSLYTLAYTADDAAARVQLVQDCSTAIRAVYNLHQAYQVVENPEGEKYFQDEAQRLRATRPQDGN